MAYDYEADRPARACSDLVENCKTKRGIKFGAVLVKDDDIIGYGWTQQPDPKLRLRVREAGLTHVGYKIDAEQVAFLDAITPGEDGLAADVNGTGCVMYVAGFHMNGPLRGTMVIKRERTYACVDCPPSVLIPNNIRVAVPMTHGWELMSPEEAYESGKALRGTGYWKGIAQGVAT